jgi:putative sigma-54 modulation protein
MKLFVTGRQMDVTPAARQQIEKKLARLERLLNDSALSAQCVLSHQRGRVVCELTVHARQDHTMHAIGRDGDLARAVSMAVDKIVQQAQRLKDRWTTRRRSPINGVPARAASTAAEGPPAEAAPRVIRYRASAVKPMSVEDAVEELSAGAQHVLVFRDAASDEVAVLWRRPDGNFWLIGPDA